MIAEGFSANGTATAMTQRLNAATLLDRALIMMERHRRIPAIWAALTDGSITADEAAKLIGEWWSDSESPTSNLGRNGIRLVLVLFRRLQALEPPQRLPDVVTVYRGCSPRERKRPQGISWTLSRDKAEWFARRYAFGKPMIVLQATNPRGSVLCFIGDRAEREVIVDPKEITEFAIRDIT